MSDKVPTSAMLSSGLVDRLLTFIDAPWKGVLLVIMVVLIGSGYIFYSERDRIATAILAHKPEPRLERSVFKAEARQLLSAAHADAVMLAEVRAGDNVITNIDGLDREGHEFVTISGPRPLLEAGSDITRFIHFLRNEPFCFYVDIGQPIAERRAEAQLGIRRACQIAVPPTLGVLVGSLWIGWKAPPSAEVEDRAKVSISDAALRLATW